MKQKEIEVRGVYLAKVSNRIVQVRVDRIEERYDSFLGRDTTRYHVTNLKTSRTTVFRSAAKFRSRVLPQIETDGKLLLDSPPPVTGARI